MSSQDDLRKICEDYSLSALYTDENQVRRFADAMQNFYSSVTALYSRISPEHIIQFRGILKDAIDKSAEWIQFLFKTDYNETQQARILEFVTGEVQSSAENYLRTHGVLQ
jgi:hypothetical protein